MVLLQAMQGLGKPGVNIWGTTMGTPCNADFNFPGYSAFGPNFLNGFAKNRVVNPVKQRVYRLLVPEAILNPPITWRGETFCGQSHLHCGTYRLHRKRLWGHTVLYPDSDYSREHQVGFIARCLDKRQYFSGNAQVDGRQLS